MSNVQDHPDIEQLPLEIDGIHVRETIRQIFRNPNNGTPDNISRAGCLALALRSNEVGGGDKGYVVWNAWREQFPVIGQRFGYQNHTNFNKQNFNSLEFSFSHFKFGNGAEFKNTKWGNGVKFKGACWGNWANFCNAIWGEGADFSGAVWGYGASFNSAKWGDLSKFDGTCWGDFADFEAAEWGYLSQFRAACWGMNARFNHSYWRAGACFSWSQWGAFADFQNASFESSVNFRGTKWGDKANFNNVKWQKVKEQKSKNRMIVPSAFQAVNFSGTCFEGMVSFSDTCFDEKIHFGLLPTHFERQKIKRNENGVVIFDQHGNVEFEDVEDQHRHTTFHAVPEFHGCELHQDTSFEGAEFPKPTGSEEAARAYRSLKLAFSKQQAIREEQRFFRLEMAEEAMGYRNKAKQSFRQFELLTGLHEGFSWVLYKAYSVLSDYGFSVARPLVLLVAAWTAFATIYGHSSGQEVCWVWGMGCELRGDWLGYSLRQALPIFGFDKPDQTTVIEMKDVAVGWLFLHKTISLAALFLIGLALRNLFKLK